MRSPNESDTRHEGRLNPRHAQIRTIARILGPLLLVAGVIFSIVGMVGTVRFFVEIRSFFSATDAMEPFSGPPKYFWCFYFGLPLVGIGGGLTRVGYLGWFTRYVAGETAPVQKDTFNYLANGIRPGVKDLVQAVREGLTEDSTDIAAANKKFCPSCGQPADIASNFCSGCGQKL